MAENKTGVRARRMQASYLDIGVSGTTAFNLLGTGFKDLNEEPGAKTTSKRYVNDASETSSVSGYEWKTAFNADQIRSIEVIEYICRLGELEKTGGDVEKDYVVVDLDVAIESKQDTYRARKKRVAIAVSTFGNEDGEMTCEGELLGIGDMVEGEFNTSTKTFTPTTEVVGG